MRAVPMGDVSKALRDRVGVLIEIVDAGAREDKIVTVSADDIGNGLGERWPRGDSMVCILISTKPTINPESAPQLAEMVSFLKYADKRAGLCCRPYRQQGRT